MCVLKNTLYIIDQTVKTPTNLIMSFLFYIKVSRRLQLPLDHKRVSLRQNTINFFFLVLSITCRRGIRRRIDIIFLAQLFSQGTINLQDDRQCNALMV